MKSRKGSASRAGSRMVKSMSRPFTHTPELIQEICDDLSQGITLSEICRRDHMPTRATVYSWGKADPEIAVRIAGAREAGFDVIAEECLAIAEDGSNDYVERKNKDGRTELAYDAEHVQRSKLRVETRLKLLAKWSPKKYGDRQQIANTDSEGNDLPPIQGVMFVPVQPRQEVITVIENNLDESEEDG